MPGLVAHRGQSYTYPENTLESIQAAIDCGATAVEFDIQMTVDFIPVLCHDLNLLRTAGVDVDVSSKKFSELKDICVGEPSRFDANYNHVFLTSLDDMVATLSVYPLVTVFVEIKDESIDVFGIELIIKQVTKRLKPIENQCVIIADSLDYLLLSRQQSTIPIGWIIHQWDQDKIQLAQQHQLEYLVINHEYCPAHQHDFASDSWQWVIYETCDNDKAIELFKLGVQYVETNDICAMLDESPEYR